MNPGIMPRNDELRAAMRRAQRAETVAGQICSASNERTLEDKKSEWEQLTGRKWGVAPESGDGE